MKVVGCYIVKNEAEALKRSLKGIKGQVDEIVVVDTGSTDDTILVAKEAGAIIHTFAWQDDFALARNFALDKLTGDWVVFLDADEYFTEETAGNLRTLIKAQGKDTNLLLVRRQDIAADGQLMMSLYVPRIFRLRPDLRYAGAIHEELRQAGQQVTGIALIPESALLLMHTGYAGNLGQEKAKRNLDLLLRERERRENPADLYGYLAEAYDGIDDWENAMKYAYLDIRQGRQAITYASRSYRLLLEKLAQHKRDYQERLRIAQMAVKDFPELPEFHAELAEALAESWHYADAAQEMQQACILGLNPNGVEPSLFNEQMAGKCQKRAALFSRLAEDAAKVNITACVIVKNEEKNIAAWLKNACVYAKQCVVLDTGSTDKTCEMASAGGAEVHHYVWQDDFAAARNEALKYVMGDWIAFLDADEFFACPKDVRGLIAACSHFYPEAEAIRLTIKNVDADDGMQEISRFCNIRLFRNKSDLVYQGKVHENLTHRDALQPLQIWEEPRMQVIHTGYSGSIILQKSRRNLALLQQDIAEKGQQPRHYRYLADCYYTLGDYKQAELYALKAIDAPLKGVGTQNDMYYMVLLCMKALEESPEEQLAFAAAAERIFPAVPDFPAVQGIIQYKLGNYLPARDLLARACQLERENDGRQSCSFGDIQAMVYAAKADCEVKRNHIAQGLEDSKRAMEQNPYEEMALMVFCTLRQDIGLQALARSLQEYFSDSEQDLSFLCRFCERNGFGDLYAYYEEQLQSRYGKKIGHQEYLQLLKAGEWSALAVKLQRGLAANVDVMVNLLCRLEQVEGKSARQAESQLLRLLPADMQRLWKAVAGGEEVTDWSCYKVMWPYILSYGDEAQLIRFTALSVHEPEVCQMIVQDLLQKEKWQEAFALLVKIPQDAADGLFWQEAGQCLYHLGDNQAAGEAFAKARQMGENTPLLNSYEAWLKKRMQK